MSTSERAFNQVKAILNKLDRSIDEAREKRTRPGGTAPPPPARPAAPAPAPAPAAAPSVFGRAQPMPPRPNAATPRYGT